MHRSKVLIKILQIFLISIQFSKIHESLSAEYDRPEPRVIIDFNKILIIMQAFNKIK